MITNILDNDLYKFSMSYAYMKLYPNAIGTFSFVDRNKTEYDNSFVELLQTKLRSLFFCQLSNDMKDWCVKNISYIPECYWEWLYYFKFEPSSIQVYLDLDNHLHILVTDKMYKVTLYEVPILATVSEAYYEWQGIMSPTRDEVLNNLMPKIAIANTKEFKFSEFGTRRRRSFDVQDIVCSECSYHPSFLGTSNVFLAYRYNLKPMGTMAHEWIMFHGANYGVLEANKLALEAWVQVFDGSLGIALTDTYGSNVFFKNFSTKLAKLFDGIRQDSGDEYEFTDKAIVKYKELGIDPLSKTIVFSNALDFQKASDIADYCRGKIKCSFGIGTNLTNDVGIKPMNIVMKLVSCQMNMNQKWRPCVKISDDIGKAIGQLDAINFTKYQLEFV